MDRTRELGWSRTVASELRGCHAVHPLLPLPVDLVGPWTAQLLENLLPGPISGAWWGQRRCHVNEGYDTHKRGDKSTNICGWGTRGGEEAGNRLEPSYGFSGTFRTARRELTAAVLMQRRADHSPQYGHLSPVLVRPCTPWRPTSWYKGDSSHNTTWRRGPAIGLSPCLAGPGCEAVGLGNALQEMD